MSTHHDSLVILFYSCQAFPLLALEFRLRFHSQLLQEFSGQHFLCKREGCCIAARLAGSGTVSTVVQNEKSVRLCTVSMKEECNIPPHERQYIALLNDFAPGMLCVRSQIDTDLLEEVVCCLHKGGERILVELCFTTL